MSPRRIRVILVVGIVLLSVGPKLTYLAASWSSHRLTPDERDYLVLAENLSTYGIYGVEPGVADSKRPPLYPLLLSPMYRIVGADVQALIRLLQVGVCGLLTIWVFVLARRRSVLVGVVAASLLALYPPLTKYSTYILTEVLALGLLFGATHFLVGLCRESTNERGSLWLGACLGAASLARTVVVPVAAIVALSWALFGRGGPATRTREALLLAAAFAAVYGAWPMRNAVSLDEYAVVNQLGAVSVGHYTAALLDEGWSLDDARREVLGSRDHLPPAPGIAQLVRTASYWRYSGHRLAVMLGSHPGLGVPFPMAGYNLGASLPAPVRYANYAINFIILFGALLALGFGVRFMDREALATLVIPLGLIATYSLSNAIPRYQVIPYALLTLCAAQGYGRCLDAYGRTRIRHPAAGPAGNR